MIKHVKKTFVTGLFVLIPILVTIYIIYIIVSFADTAISPIMRSMTSGITGKEFYIPGAGLVLFIIITYLTGVLASNFIGKRLLTLGEKMLKKIPFVKGIYSSVKDMTDAFSSDKAKSFKEVVLVEFPFKGRYAVGFITNRIQNSEKVTFCSVFVPTTPNPTSGYLIMIPEEEIIFLNMPIDDAIKYIVSLGTLRFEFEWKEKNSFTSS
jgi:uncharacterized membrane protein